METLLIFTAQVAIYAAIPIALMALRPPMRTVAIYIYLGIVLTLGGFIGSVYSLPITPMVNISGGNLAYGAFLYTAVLILIIQRDVSVLRDVIWLVVLVNIFKLLTFGGIGWALQSQQTINPYSTDGAVFTSSVYFLVLGGVLIVLELFLLILLFEGIKQRLPNPTILTFAYPLSFIAVLMLDGVLFPLFALGFDPRLTAIVVGNVQGKLWLALAYSIPMILFLLLFRPRLQDYVETPITLGDLRFVPHERLLQEVVERGQQLAESETRFRQVWESTSDAMVLSDSEGTVLMANSAYLDLYGYSEEQVIGRSFAIIFPPEMRDTAMAQYKAIFASGDVPAPFEAVVQRADGSERVVDSRAVFLTNAGRRAAMLSTIRDITARKRAEARVETQLRRLTALHTIDTAITSTQDLARVLDVVLEQAIIQLGMDAAYVVLLLDPSSQLLTYAAGRGFQTNGIERSRIPFGAGLPGEALRERHAVSLSNPLQSPVFLRADLLAEEDFVRYFAAPMITKDRAVGVLEVFHRTLSENDDEWLAFLETLATQAAIAVENAYLFGETQRLLQESQAQAQLTQEIIDSAPEGMLVLDSQQCLVLANPVARAYLPVLAEMRVGDPLASLSGHPLANFLHTFGLQQPWDEASWGQPPHIYEVAAQPLNSGQQAGGWVLVMRDVTEERDRQRYQQVQDRLSTVGQLAAGIAHDFNNIMGGITLHTQLLRNIPNLSAKHERYLTMISDQSSHAANLIRQILDFSRRSPMERAALDVAPLIKELIKLLERTLPENISLELGYDRNEYVINGDPTRLQQMLMNLAVNARDAMPQGGTLSFQLSTHTVSPDQPPLLPDMGEGEWLQLAVTDTGSGIESEHLPHLFEPFFTTKGPGRGTGLGLAQVYGIVKQHDGSIGVDSQPGHGTTFAVYLPLYNVPPAPVQPAISDEVRAGDGEVILLVEDNLAMRMVMSESLEGLGYQVFSASDGVEALEILDRQGSAVSLMLSDMVMPRMGGVELSQAARRRQPALKIAIMTGHPLHESEDELRQAGINGWMRKPFTIDELAEQVQAALGVAKR